jgi:hypothetical protein
VLLNPGGIPNRQYIEGVANLAAFFNASSVAILGGKSLISYFKTFQVLNAPGTFTARLINGHWDKLARVPRVGSAEDAADWVGDKAEKAGEAISEGAKKLGSALNPFD